MIHQSNPKPNPIDAKIKAFGSSGIGLILLEYASFSL